MVRNKHPRDHLRGDLPQDPFSFTLPPGPSSSSLMRAVGEIVAALKAANAKAALGGHGCQGKGDDLVLYFYESFLAQYDPKTRKRRGVYYTPKPVVRYMVRAVHRLLKTRFGLSDGLASPGVTLLDPAAGPLTFPIEAIRLAFEESDAKYGPENRSRLLREHILPHFHAFEILLVPYLIGHLRVQLLLEELGLSLREGERFRLYLANPLEVEDPPQSLIPLLPSSPGEDLEAMKTEDESILVVLGNPPYAATSANRSAWTERLLRTGLDGMPSYYQLDGQPLSRFLEGANPKPLQDDYVKFLRFAQWRVHRNGWGIVAMVTNNSYLDSLIFRGMRHSLLQTFDEIYLLDLHGNARKRETTPDGRKDENVFDIQQGVAVGIFIKHGDPNQRGVYHADLYGSREEKYKWLEEHTPETAGYRPITPQFPSYFFVPRRVAGLEHYQKWPQITQVFPLNSTGIKTSRDHFVIDFDPQGLLNRIRAFKHSQLDDDGLRGEFGIPIKKGWSIRKAWDELQSVDDDSLRNYVHPILYRPFDVRYIFYHEAVIEGPRLEVMRHMLAGENLALVLPRRVEHVGPWQHVFLANGVAIHWAVSLKTADYLFPLYLYPSPTTPNMFDATKRPNLAEWLLPKLTAAYGFSPAPEEVLAYIYAVLYSPTYRSKYLQELRADFPRIPFTQNADLFHEMAKLGQKLIDLHLLHSADLNSPLVKYQGTGGDRVGTVYYHPQEERVYIGSNAYFEGVIPQMWEYRIGGYRVLEKYLKDRKGRPLEDPMRYLRIATAIAHTMEVQAQIDQVYLRVEEVGGEVLGLE